MLPTDRSARPCVDADDEWVFYADFPLEEMQPPKDQFDLDLWERVKQHPWRCTAYGPEAQVDQLPEYKGVVRFTDKLAITSAHCGTRANIVQFWGRVFDPVEWPQETGTMVCEPPPGYEPLPDEPDALAFWTLPIRGELSLDGEHLVITHEGREYRYEPITLDEFVVEFDRKSFVEVDPLHELEKREASNWEEIDFPNQPTGVTTTTTRP